MSHERDLGGRRLTGVDLVRRHLAAEDAGDLEATMATFTAEPWYAVPAQDVLLRGRDRLREHYMRLFAAFPDLRNEDVRTYDAGERVFARIRVERTHSGAWGPFEPTGTRVVTEALAEFVLAPDGLLEAEIVHANPLEALRQIGVVPTADAMALAERAALLSGTGALVTGASRGIGAGIAEGLAAAGARVAALARRRGDLEPLAARITAAGGPPPVLVAADVADVGALRAAVDRAAAELGRLDLLVNNAGINLRSAALETPVDDFDHVLAVNLRGPLVASQAAAAVMMAAGGGAVVNVASLGSSFGVRRGVAYAASKGGLAQLTRTLALEWGPHGIRVNAVAPGYVETDLTQPLRDDSAREAAIAARIPLGRWGTTADVAGAVVLLASPLARYVTGHVLYADGGYGCDG